LQPVARMERSDIQWRRCSPGFAPLNPGYTCYTAQLANSVYVLHVFQKKSKSGIATPKPDMDLIRRRYAEAERHHRERQN
jgi:hypothetical protein